MKKLILLFAIIFIISCNDETPVTEEVKAGEASAIDLYDAGVGFAEEAFKNGYMRGALNVLKHGNYNENQWKLDSIEMDKILIK